MRIFLHIALPVVSACWLGCGAAYAEKRVALVIGNGAYKHAPRLPNSANDANDVAESLSSSQSWALMPTLLCCTSMRPWPRKSAG